VFVAIVAWITGFLYKESPQWVPLKIQINAIGTNEITHNTKISLAGRHELLLRTPIVRTGFSKKLNAPRIPVQMTLSFYHDQPQLITELVSYGTVQSDRLYLLNFIDVGAPGLYPLKLTGLSSIPQLPEPSFLEIHLSAEQLKRRLIVFQITAWFSGVFLIAGLLTICFSSARKPARMPPPPR
jgi:hypothetical protein